MSCPEFEPMIADRLFGEPDAASRAALDRHLAGCPDCSRTLAGMEAALGVASRRESAEPDAASWAAFDARLEARLGASNAAVAAGASGVSPRSIPLKIRALRWAAAVAFFAAGLVLGRTLLAPGPISPAPESVVQAQPESPAAVFARTEAYLDRSRMLLLEIAHFDPATDDPAVLDLPLRSRIARELAGEAASLDAALSASDTRRLRALVADLEAVLQQIAALDASREVPALEIVRSDVESRALLFRIDIERLRGAEPRTLERRSRHDA